MRAAAPGEVDEAAALPDDDAIPPFVPSAVLALAVVGPAVLTLAVVRPPVKVTLLEMVMSLPETTEAVLEGKERLERLGKGLEDPAALPEAEPGAAAEEELWASAGRAIAAAK